MRVRATRVGYYAHIRRREGDVFTLEPVETVDFPKVHEAAATARELVRLNPTGDWPKITIPVEQQFSSSWMEKVGTRTPETQTSAPQALKRSHDRMLAGRSGAVA